MASAKGGGGKNTRPVIIKKVVDDDHGHGHHGGAWKVAYADFVTAMMAFFLLLWLLSTTDQNKLKGIADYYAPTNTTIGGLGGLGVLAGTAPADEGIAANAAVSTSDGVDDPGEVTSEATPGDPIPAIDAWSLVEMEMTDADADSDAELAEVADGTLSPAEAEQRGAEAREMAEVQESLETAIEENPALTDLADNIAFERVEEGLLIRVMDRADQPMFASGRANFETDIATLVANVGTAIADLPNGISVTGHTDAVPFASTDGYTNWELSADRANATRRALIEAGVAADRFARISGLAATEPQRPEDPEHPSNRRIEILLAFAD